MLRFIVLIILVFNLPLSASDVFENDENVIDLKQGNGIFIHNQFKQRYAHLKLKKDFNLRFGSNGMYGDFAITGESIVCNKSKYGCVWNSTQSIENATTTSINEANFNLNSSRAKLKMPILNNDKNIAYARLYWQGHMAQRSNQDDPLQTIKNQLKQNIKGWSSIKFQTPDGSRHQLKAKKEDCFWKSAWGKIDSNAGIRFAYQASVDVTGILKNYINSNSYKNLSKAQKKNLSFASGDIITSSQGKDKDIIYWDNTNNAFRIEKVGHFGGWALVIVYDMKTKTDKNLKFKHLALYDGFAILSPQNQIKDEVSIDIDGFLTPSKDKVDASLAFFAGRTKGAENPSRGYFKIRDKDKNYHFVYDDKNPKYNPANGTFTIKGENINHQRDYHSGTDLNMFDISSIMQNGQTNTNIKLGAYFINGSSYNFNLGMVAFSTTIHKREHPSENLNHNPTWGAFNVASEGIYENYLGGVRYPKFNIPTQVVNKRAKFRITSHAKKPKVMGVPYIYEKKIPTIIAIELVDNSKHKSTITCDGCEESIAERFWVPMFDNNGKNISNKSFENALQKAYNEKLINAKNMEEYLSQASKNATFRIVANTIDNNHNYMKIKMQNDKYKIEDYDIYINWLFQYVKNENNNTYNFIEDLPCKTPVKDDNKNLIKYVKDICSGDFMGYKQLFRCNECLLGYHSANTCSRDNFSIRPESFYVEIKDVNHKNPEYLKRFALDRTGNLSPKTNPIDLSAGYKYKIEINATSHKDMDKNSQVDLKAVKGYSGFFPKQIDNENQKAIYKWSSVKNQCNDINNTPIFSVDPSSDIYFYNGLAKGDTLIDNVGEYNLTLVDKKWTMVDWKKEYLNHHKKAKILIDGIEKEVDVRNFFAENGDGKDCSLESSFIPKNNLLPQLISKKLTNLNGCIITNENHENQDTKIKYKTQNIITHPYKFVSSLKNSYWEPNKLSFGMDNWIYIADINRTNFDKSVHFKGLIKALGKNNHPLSNFVNECYAKDINISLKLNNFRSKNPPSPYPKQKYEIFAYNQNKQEIYHVHKSKDYNLTREDFHIPKTAFQKDLNGTLDISININFSRNTNKPSSPIPINFKDINISCFDKNKCTMQADLAPNHTPKGGETYNNNLSFVYGRNWSRDYFQVTNKVDALVRYEIYCDIDNCNRIYKYLGVQNSLDGRWYANPTHNVLIDGGISTIKDGNTLNYKTKIVRNKENELINGIEGSIEIAGTPNKNYTEPIHIQTSPWLIYDKNKKNAKFNTFYVEFVINSWAGQGQLGLVVDENLSSHTSKRMEW